MNPIGIMVLGCLRILDMISWDINSNTFMGYITNYIQNWVVYSNTELNTNLRGGFDVEKLTIGQPPISPKVWM